MYQKAFITTKITRLARSAPLKSSQYLVAVASRSTLGSMGLFFAIDFRIETRSSALGRGTYTGFANLPGLKKARSISSSLFVAPMT